MSSRSTSSIFIPLETLTLLSDIDRVELEGEELLIKPEGCRYRTTESVRVLDEVTTGVDTLKLSGKVCAREKLTGELGGELLGDSMLIEDNAYDIVSGFTCELIGGLPSDRTEGEILQSLHASIS